MGLFLEIHGTHIIGRPIPVEPTAQSSGEREMFDGITEMQHPPDESHDEESVVEDHKPPNHIGNRMALRRPGDPLPDGSRAQSADADEPFRRAGE